MEKIKKLILSAHDIFLNPESRSLLINFNRNEKTLWKHISSGYAIDDVYASEMLYGSNPSSINYLKFKSSFWQKLDHIILLYKGAKNNKYQQIFLRSIKDLHIIKILFTLGFRRIAIDRAKILLKRVEKYEINDIAAEVCRYLFKDAAQFKGDIVKAEMFYKLHKSFNQIVEKEIESEWYFSKLISPQLFNKSVDEEISGRSRQYFKILAKDLKSIKSHRFLIQSYRIGLIECERAGDIRGAAYLAEEVMDIFDNYHFDHLQARQIFRRKLINYKIQLNELIEAERLLRVSLEEQPEKDHKWFLNQEQILLIYFRSQRYEEARFLLNYVLKQRRFSSESDEVKDKWKLYSLYLEILGHLGAMASTPKSSRINRKINELKRYSGDKKGMNLALLIIQTIFIYKSDNIDLMEIQTDSIKKYSSKYLKDGDNERSRIFLRMLLQLPLKNYEIRKFERRISSLKSELQEKKVPYTIQATDIEVIPYEELWSIVISSVNVKRHSSTSRQMAY